jgi:hypothetical protein
MRMCTPSSFCHSSLRTNRELISMALKNWHRSWGNSRTFQSCIAVVDDEQLTAGQAGAVGPGWGSPVPVIGSLKQNKIEKSKGFALKRYRGGE